MKFYYKGMLAVHLENGASPSANLRCPRARKGSRCCACWPAGICNTDLELQRGYYGFAGIPGHEFVAEVVEADTPTLVGKRVVGRDQPGLHAIATGAGGDSAGTAPRRTVLGIVNQPGAFQEFFVLPERNLHVVPDDVPTERAVFTGAAGRGLRDSRPGDIPPGETVAVLGDGKLGLADRDGLERARLQVHQFGRHAGEAAIAVAPGADGRRERPLPAAEYDWVVDATGSPEGLRHGGVA